MDCETLVARGSGCVFDCFQRELMQVSDLVRSRSQVQANECVMVESSTMAAGAQG